MLRPKPMLPQLIMLRQKNNTCTTDYAKAKANYIAQLSMPRPTSMLAQRTVISQNQSYSTANYGKTKANISGTAI